LYSLRASSLRAGALGAGREGMEPPPKKAGFSLNNAATGAKRKVDLSMTDAARKAPNVEDMRRGDPRRCIGIENPCKFDPRRTAKKKPEIDQPQCQVPKVSQLGVVRVVCQASLVEPPTPVLGRLHLPTELLIGIDIETHDWIEEPNKKGRYGLFGCYTLTTPEELEFKRIVQIGWVIGALSEQVDFQVAKERNVRPDGFRISKKATKIHGLSHERAIREGVPLVDVLEELMGDVAAAYKRGGRVISHHLHHDAMIIMREFERAGMQDMADAWVQIAKQGVCTMDPGIGQWVFQCTAPLGSAQACDNGGKAQPRENDKRTLKLKEMVDWLVPGNRELKQRAHTAGADAKLHCLVYRELVRLESNARNVANSSKP